MVMKNMVQGISPNVPRHLEYYHVLRRVDWEEWINGAIPESQHGHQEPAETPSPAQATPAEPSDKQEKPQRNRKRDVEADAKLRNRIENVLAKTRREWGGPKKRPAIDVMARELERLDRDPKLPHKERLGYKFQTIRKILKGTYKTSVRLEIAGL